MDGQQPANQPAGAAASGWPSAGMPVADPTPNNRYTGTDRPVRRFQRPSNRKKKTSSSAKTPPVEAGAHELAAAHNAPAIEPAVEGSQCEGGFGLLDLDDDSLDALVAVFISTIFLPAACFDGPKPGMLFKYGRLGVGYYSSIVPAPAFEDSIVFTARQLSGGLGSKMAAFAAQSSADRMVTHLLVTFGSTCKRTNERLKPFLAMMRQEKAACILNNAVNRFSGECEKLRKHAARCLQIEVGSGALGQCPETGPSVAKHLQQHIEMAAEFCAPDHLRLALATRAYNGRSLAIDFASVAVISRPHNLTLHPLLTMTS